MDTSDVVVGHTYRLQTDFGHGPGSVPAGADVVVLGIYPPGTPGIGAIDEDTVLSVYTPSTGWAQYLAIGVTMFADLFREVTA